MKKLLATTGATVASYSQPLVGGNAAAFDGTYIWTANRTSNRVQNLTSTGTSVDIFHETAPEGIAFDGTHMWVANSGSNNVSQFLASTGAVVGTYAVGANPKGVAFDGSSIWVANSGSNTVTRLSPPGQQ